MDADCYVGKQDILYMLLPITHNQTEEEHKSAAAAEKKEKLENSNINSEHFLLTHFIFIWIHWTPPITDCTLIELVNLWDLLMLVIIILTVSWYLLSGMGHMFAWAT